MEFIRLDPTRKTAQQLCESQCFVQTAPDDGDKCEDAMKRFLMGAPGKATGWFKSGDGNIFLEVENHQGKDTYFYYGPTKWQAEECPDQEAARKAYTEAMEEFKKPKPKAKAKKKLPHPEITRENVDALLKDLQDKFPTGTRVRFQPHESIPRSKKHWPEQPNGTDGNIQAEPKMHFSAGFTDWSEGDGESCIWATVLWDNGNNNNYPVFIQGETPWDPETHTVGDACLIVIDEDEDEDEDESPTCIDEGGDPDPDGDTCDECGEGYCPACETYHHCSDCSRY